jgi:hypothetical protein
MSSAFFDDHLETDLKSEVIPASHTTGVQAVHGLRPRETASEALGL